MGNNIEGITVIIPIDPMLLIMIGLTVWYTIALWVIRENTFVDIVFSPSESEASKTTGRFVMWVFSPIVAVVFIFCWAVWIVFGKSKKTHKINEPDTTTMRKP